MMKLFSFTLRLIVGLLVGVAEGIWWLCYAARQFMLIGGDAVKSRRSLTGGVLHCPEGHPVTTEGDLYECQLCGFIYEGSVWICANPECGAITTYVKCPTCRRGIRNPYRWGRP